MSQYIQATNTGVGFITHDDRDAFTIQGFLDDLWVTDDSDAATAWIARVGGTTMNRDSAQALVDSSIAIAQQSAPRAVPIVQKNTMPVITLP